MFSADGEKPICFTKVIDEENVPTGVPANSKRYHQNYPSVLVEKDSSPKVWSHDPVDDEKAMAHLHHGLAALLGTEQATLPDPVEAEWHFLEAIKLHNDFTRAWINLSIALVSQHRLADARDVLLMLVSKGEIENAWPMTIAARAKIHHNLGQVYYRLHAESSNKAETLAEMALSEYKLADELEGHINSSGLLPMLVVQVDLGLTGEQPSMVERIQDFVRRHGPDAAELVAEYTAKYAQIAHLKLVPETLERGAKKTDENETKHACS